ncbi:MAG: hypothetical protein WAS23_08120, partial [Dokdonella sp.]
RQGEPPYGIGPAAKRGVPAPTVTLPGIDAPALRLADPTDRSAIGGARAKRLAIALGNPVNLDPAQEGRWQVLEDGSLLWRLRIQVPGATDLHLGFDRYALTQGASLWVIGANDYYEGPYTADDPAPLWVPVVPGDTAMIELHLPAGSTIERTLLTLTDVGAGYRDLFNAAPRIGNPGASGACNVNVVCPLGQPYTAEERALAYYEFRADNGTTYICTATLLSDVPADRKNYVLTAAHCMSTASEVATMRLYWNYQSTNCAINTGISFTQNQTGAALRATRADADFTLVELNQNPDPSWNLFHAGWDASGVAPSGSIGLHHPSGDVAKVNHSPVAPRTINNCIGTGGVSTGTHWYTGPYDEGTTEGGSSGSGLWIPADDAGGRGRRLIGVLSGGTAMCFGSVPDDGFDCYGKFSAGWNGPTAASRLRDWLDPAATNTLSIPGVDHVAAPTSSDPVLATRIAAENQARQLRGQGQGIGAHPAPVNPNLRRQ